MGPAAVFHIILPLRFAAGFGIFPIFESGSGIGSLFEMDFHIFRPENGF